MRHGVGVSRRSSFLSLFMEYCRSMHSRDLGDELFIRVLFWCLSNRCCATQEINTKRTLSWAHKKFATRIHTLFCMYCVSSRPMLSHNIYTNIFIRFLIFVKAIFPGSGTVPPRSWTGVLDLLNDLIWAIWLPDIHKFHQHHRRR